MPYQFEEIKKVACSGAGMIGSSMAVSFALAGYPVNVYEINEPCRRKAQETVQALLESMVSLTYTTQAQATRAGQRIRFTTNPEEAFGDVQFIQENGPEKLEIKQSIVETLDRCAPRDAIICSSTSGKKISEIAANSTCRERYLAAHPFNPPHLIPLIEMTTWAGVTHQQTVKTAVAFYQAIGKEPIVLQKEKKGFVANRIAHAVWREAVSLVTEGVCTLEDVDRAVCFGPGLRYAIFGPGMIYQLSGKDGLRGCNEEFSELTGSIFADLSNISAVPSGWAELSGSQIDEEMAHMPDFKGHTNPELSSFRDRCLVELLRLHRKVK